MDQSRVFDRPPTPCGRGPAVFALLAACLLLSGSTSGAAEATSDTDAPLARWLRRFPDSDADGDGVLTMSEAGAYRIKPRREGGRRGGKGKKPEPPVAQDVAGGRYGPHKRNVFDLWKAKSEKPTPLFIYYHGGGFVSGDKSKFYTRPLLEGCLRNGISCATANYRLVKGEGAAPFPAPMLDCARMVQYARTKAKEWNIDPKRIAIGGGSAGANMSLWVGLHDDLADAKSADPVLRQSSRVSCVLSYAGPTTNDPRFKKVLGGPEADHPSVLPFYGAPSPEDLEKPRWRKVIREASAINHATADDPPMFLTYGSRLTPVPLPKTTSINAAVHHPYFGKVLKDKLDKLGVECAFYHGGKKAPREADVKFLVKHFGLRGGR